MAYKDDSTVEADRYLFLGFLLALLQIPLPVASNHPWAWSFFEVCVFELAITWLVLFATGRVNMTPTFRRAWPALLLFAMVFAWVVFQLAPLPSSLIALLSPNAAEAYSHTQTDATLSLDPSATRAAALKTLAYGVLFAMTLLLINGRRRLRTLALVLVFSGVFQAAFGALMTLSGLEFGFFIEKVHDFPLTGTGAGSLASTYPMYDSGKVGFFYCKHAHNDYLQFAAEFGLPGLTMLAGIVLLSLWHAAHAQFKRHHRMMRGLGCGVTMAIVALMIHSTVDFNLQIPANAATFVVILAMGWHTRWLGHNANSGQRSKAETDVERPADVVSLRARGKA